MTINIEELKSLLHNPTRDVRLNIADKVARGFTDGGFNVTEKQIAIDIFRVLIKDTEIQVRTLLSQHLAHSLDAPHDVIIKLATDVSQVALFVLEASYVLTEDDLIAITNSAKDTITLTAIARRDSISRELSSALLQKHDNTVIETLLQNKGANIDTKNLVSIATLCEESVPILELMVKRGGLPVTLAEKLFTLVSDEMKHILTKDYKLSSHIAEDSIKHIQEMTTTQLTNGTTPTPEMALLIEQLHAQGKLTLSLVIKSLCAGNIVFFEYIMAKLAKIPVANARILILDRGEVAFGALYKTTILPIELFHAVYCLVQIVLTETDLGRYHHLDFKHRLIARLMQDEAARKVEHMDYLMTLVQHNVRNTNPLTES